MLLPSQGNIRPDIRERTYFTFDPIPAQWGYVKFKCPTELHLPLLRWMKLHLTTYNKTILISSKLSYISQSDYKCTHNKMVSEAHLATAGFLK